MKTRNFGFLAFRGQILKIVKNGKIAVFGQSLCKNGLKIDILSIFVLLYEFPSYSSRKIGYFRVFIDNVGIYDLLKYAF